MSVWIENGSLHAHTAAELDRYMKAEAWWNEAKAEGLSDADARACVREQVNDYEQRQFLSSLGLDLGGMREPR